MDYIEENPRVVLDDELKEKLCKEFEGLKISVSGIHKHLVNKVHINLKRIENITAARNCYRVITLKKSIIEQYMNDIGLSFAKNCVFIGEAGLNLHTHRCYGCSYKGNPAKSAVPTGKVITITISGAISQAGIINVGVKKLESVSSKKRKAYGKEVKVNGKFGTRNKHFLAYLTNVMEVLDKNDMNGQYIVMYLS